MMKKYKVSIITPVRNSVDYIKECMLSVILQTYEDIEYIIIDGGSTDGTLDIIKEFSEYISYWESGYDKSMYDAMNKGVQYAHGEIISFLNADDYYCDNDVVCRMVNALQDDMDGVYGDMIKVDETKGVIKYIPLSDCDYRTLLLSGHSTFVPQSTMFIRKAFYEKIGGCSLRYKYASDYDFVLKVLKFGKICHYKSCVMVFRIHHSSITFSGRLDSDRKIIMKRHGYMNYSRLERAIIYGVSWSKYKIRMMIRSISHFNEAYSVSAGSNSKI